MSISAISSSNFFNSSTQGIQSQMQQFRQEFQQLGQDLQTGNLSGAKSDFAALQPFSPQSSSASTAQTGNSIAQEFQQLSQDLQSGNLSAAQQDYSKLQQDFQNQSGQMHAHHHHGGSDNSEINQLMNELGLQSGGLSNAQQAYSVMQNLPLLGQNGLFSAQASSPANSVSVIA
jgi:outer membrane protein assembly factor BamD (BamD/ComL family)